MALNFYTIQEAAAKLDLTTEQVRQLVSQGRLSQFRDRDKLMFKRDQVDAMAAEKSGDSAQDSGIDLEVEVASASGDAPEHGGTDAIELADESEAGIELADEEPGELKADDTAEIDVAAIQKAGEEEEEEELTLQDTGTGAGAIDLEETGHEEPAISLEDTSGVSMQAEEDTDGGGLTLEDSQAPAKPRKETPKSGTGTGINVFEAEEVAETADPMAQTRVIKAIRDEDEGLEADLGAEGIGSGSGLLDLTREADETSLGAAELLMEDEDESLGDVSGVGTGVASSSAGTIGGLPGSATGAFEGAGGTEVDAEAPSGLAGVEEGGEPMPELAVASTRAAEEEDDPIGSSFGGAALLGIFSILAVAAIVAYTGYSGSIIQLTAQLLKFGDAGTPPTTALLYWMGILLVANFVLAFVGWMIGRMIAKRG